VLGKPVKTSTPLTPVATVRAFWAASQADTSGAEIPITSSTAPVGLYWNSARLQATINQFPAAPPTAKFIRLTVSAPTTVDANPTNSTRYLPLGEFQARDSTANTLSEDAFYNGGADSVLHPLDRSDGSVKAFAYRAVSDLGGTVQVINDSGAFFYDPTFAPSIQSLGAGETVQDTVRFLAIKSQTLVDEATLSIPIRGENDSPTANPDSTATTNFTRLTILPSTLLANDRDPDRSDQLTLKSVGDTSGWGAAIRVELNDAQTEIEQIL
jgi:VCBS repeat-containing protein